MLTCELSSNGSADHITRFARLPLAIAPEFKPKTSAILLVTALSAPCWLIPYDTALPASKRNWYTLWLESGMAHYFFAIGLCAAGLTSAITAPLAGAYAVCGMLGWSTQMSDTRFKLVAITILVFGALVASLGLDPVAVIIFAQAANGLLLPIVTCYLVWLVNQKSVMKGYTNSLLLNLVIVPVILLIFGLSLYKLSNLIF